MRFSLQDVKKTVQRRHGELAISLHFLRSGEAAQEIQRLIAYHEQNLGRPQRQFSLDEARACIGDYRLAACLLATLSTWYSWSPRPWSHVLREAGRSDLGAISSPLQLRLALYTFVNEHYAGFLHATQRAEALAQFAQSLQLSSETLERLLVLDAEDEALLVRVADQPPTVEQVANLYNQWTFEVALCNASSVRFGIDCAAFLAGAGAPQRSAPSDGVGTVIKRLCYLARRLGVYYDLAYEQGAAQAPLLLHLTLYGPQDVTGAPQQYGIRLARLCRLLLGYGTRSEGQRGKSTLVAALMEAEATIHFLQRSYNFALDARLLQLLPRSTEEDQPPAQQATSSLFDSGVEQLFAEAFLAMGRSQGVDGWTLEREPEPLLLERNIFIPDFALTRGKQRVYVEILGFWTPSYRERKVQKLQQLRKRKDLLLLIPEEAREAFAPVASAFPVVYYEGQIVVSELLYVLRATYDDFAERLQSLNSEAIQAQVRREGLLSERACYSVLHCYRRAEIQRAAEVMQSGDIGFLPGLGLYYDPWLEQLQTFILSLLQRQETMALSALFATLRTTYTALAVCEDETLEVLLTHWSQVHIIRDSLFEAQVTLLEPAITSKNENPPSLSAKTVKRSHKEKRGPAKDRIESSDVNTVQTDLWGE